MFLNISRQEHFENGILFAESVIACVSIKHDLCKPFLLCFNANCNELSNCIRLFLLHSPTCAQAVRFQSAVAHTAIFKYFLQCLSFKRRPLTLSTQVLYTVQCIGSLKMKGYFWMHCMHLTLCKTAAGKFFEWTSIVCKQSRTFDWKRNVLRLRATVLTHSQL